LQRRFKEHWQIVNQPLHDGHYGINNHGYARLTEVLKQVALIDVSKSLLCQIKNLIGISEKRGVCHILVSDGRIKSWVDTYA
jgi:hypothetical protein